MSANLPFSQYLVRDKARSTLSADITAAATSCSFTSGGGAKFPASDFCVKIDDETIYVSTRSTDTCSSLTRGYNGTTAASHLANAPVYQSADAALIQRIYDNLSGHNHVKADITDFGHTHPQGDITNLVTDLAGKAASTHDILTAHNGFPGGTTTFLRADGTFAAPAGGGGPTLLKKTANQTINAGAGVYTDVTGLTFAVVNGTDYAFRFYVVFQSAATTTGHKVSVNCPTGTLDFFCTNQTIANSSTAGVATWLQRHSVTRDDMTLLTGTITAGVDLVVLIEGRYLCTANGTFAVRFANELAANTQLVVQRGSWGMVF